MTGAAHGILTQKAASILVCEGVKQELQIKKKKYKIKPELKIL